MLGTTVTRRELYDEVWATPMRTLAKKYGLSDVGLAKICKKHNIPRPPVGFWTKRAHGKSVKQAPLPSHDPDPVAIRLDPKRLVASEMRARFAAFGDGELITVGDRLRSPHPLVRKTRERLKSMEPRHDGVIEGSSEATLSICVGRQSIGRALRVMDALLKYWESIGGSVRVRASRFDRRPVTALGLSEDSVDVALAECTERIVGEGAESPRAFRWRERRRPNGRLKLTIEGQYGSGRRSTWADGKRQRLEGLLGSFVAGVHAHLAHSKDARLDAECEGRQQRRAAELRERKSRRTKQEEDRREDLFGQVGRWEDAQRIRAYLTAIRHVIDVGTMRAIDPEAHGQWFEWASRYADLIDPIAHEGGSPFDVTWQGPTNMPVADLDLTRRARAFVQALEIGDTDELALLERSTIERVAPRESYGVWVEVCRVLEGLGYDAKSGSLP